MRRVMRYSVYIVAWRKDRIIKVGYTSGGRWSTFVNRGAELIAVVTQPTARIAIDYETALGAMLAEHGSPAFSARAESVPYVGHNGSGWCECYRVPESSDLDAVIEELRLGSERSPLRSPSWTPYSDRTPDLTRPDPTRPDPSCTSPSAVGPIAFKEELQTVTREIRKAEMNGNLELAGAPRGRTTTETPADQGAGEQQEASA